MRSLSSFTPHYAEEVTTRLAQLHGELDDNVDLLHLLQSLFPDEWENFTERLGVPGLSDSDKIDADALCRWASDRGQVLSRTVRGVMLYGDALRVLARLEGVAEEEVEAVVGAKFEYVVACQHLRQAEAVEEGRRPLEGALRRRPPPRVRRQPARRVRRGRGRRLLLDPARRRPAHRRGAHALQGALPGNPIIGEGKPENQNHAVIFTRGEYLQTLDMNQDNYMGEAFKMRNLLEGFVGDGAHRRLPRAHLLRGGRRRRLVRGGERVRLRHDRPALPDVAAARALPLRPPRRVGQGVGDVERRRLEGGEDAPRVGGHLRRLQRVLRGGGVEYCEFIHVGKGRDMGFIAVNGFEQKISTSRATRCSCSRAPADAPPPPAPAPARMPTVRLVDRRRGQRDRRRRPPSPASCRRRSGRTSPPTSTRRRASCSSCRAACDANVAILLPLRFVRPSSCYLALRHGAHPVERNLWYAVIEVRLDGDRGLLALLALRDADVGRVLLRARITFGRAGYRRHRPRLPGAGPPRPPRRARPAHSRPLTRSRPDGHDQRGAAVRRLRRARTSTTAAEVGDASSWLPLFQFFSALPRVAHPLPLVEKLCTVALTLAPCVVQPGRAHAQLGARGAGQVAGVDGGLRRGLDAVEGRLLELLVAQGAAHALRTAKWSLKLWIIRLGRRLLLLLSSAASPASASRPWLRLAAVGRARRHPAGDGAAVVLHARLPGAPRRRRPRHPLDRARACGRCCGPSPSSSRSRSSSRPSSSPPPRPRAPTPTAAAASRSAASAPPTARRHGLARRSSSAATAPGRRVPAVHLVVRHRRALRRRPAEGARAPLRRRLPDPLVRRPAPRPHARRRRAEGRQGAAGRSRRCGRASCTCSAAGPTSGTSRRTRRSAAPSSSA